MSENKSVTAHYIARVLGQMRPAYGGSVGGSLWKKIAGIITQNSAADSVSIETLFRLAAGCELETLRTVGAPLTVDVNDYDPGPGYFLELHPVGDRIITGLAGGAPDRWHFLRNYESSSITLPLLSPSSASGNRFYFLTASGKVVLYGGEAAFVWYEDSRWIVWKVAQETLPMPPVLGDLVYANATPEYQNLAGNITATKKFLRQTGTGAVSAAPDWDTLVSGDLPNIDVIHRTDRGALWKAFSTEEEVVIAAAAFSDSAADLLPADSIIDFTTERVTVAIPTATNFNVGTSAAATRFDNSVAVAIDTTSVGMNHMKGNVTTENAGPTQRNAAKIRITPNATPANANGRVVLSVFGWTAVPATS